MGNLWLYLLLYPASCQHLDGLEVASQILMPDDGGSNPKADSINFKLTEFVLVWACFNPSGILNPAFLLSASRLFNRWPSVWFGSLLCSISMRLHGLEGDFQ